MKAGKEVNEWGGSEWEERAPEESKREAGLEDLVQKVSTYFYENESFIHVFEVFVETNAHKIDLTVEEMKLEYTDLYDEYQALFERKIEEFIQDQGFTVEDFYERLRQALDRDPWSHEAVFAKIMTAVADFDIFMRMMREAAEGLPQEQRASSSAELSAVVVGEEEGKCNRRASRK
ncbi:unnamed protein product [Scytosiphon promiscuus]